LNQMVADGDFREDLYYRLNVVPIKIPPLRKRAEDIPLLCQHFITQFNSSLNRQVKGVAPAAMSSLLQHCWPGNVRELENAIERAMVLSEGDLLKKEHFQEFMAPAGSRGTTGQLPDGFSLKHAQKVLEKELITKALKATEGNRTQASRLLEISHPSLLSKMKAYNIDL
jgi:two-component system response regulator AtoC